MSPNAITRVLIRRREREISGRRGRGYVIAAESQREDTTLLILHAQEGDISQEMQEM